MAERWKPVVGYEGLYEVSDLGKVKSLARKVDDNGGTRLLPERILKGHVNRDGYIRYELRDGISSVKRFGHVLVMEAFNPCTNDKEVNHINLDKSDNRLSNLEWVTHAENMRHAKDNGALEGRKKRSFKKVHDHTTGEIYESVTFASQLFGVTVSTISGACRGEYKVRGHILSYE